MQSLQSVYEREAESLSKTVKSWREFHECCPTCLGYTAVYTAGKPTAGDLAFCRSCYCQGVIARDPWGLYIEWPDDMCAKCYRRLDLRVRRSIELLCHEMDMKMIGERVSGR